MTKIVGARIDRRSRSRPHPSFGLVCTSWVSVTRRKFHGARPSVDKQIPRSRLSLAIPGLLTESEKGIHLDTKEEIIRKRMHWAAPSTPTGVAALVPSS